MLFVPAARAALDQTIVTLTMTNAPVPGDTLTVNGSVRTWTNTVVTASTQILTNSNIGLATTNLWRHITTYNFGPTIRMTWMATNSVRWISNPGVTLDVGVTGAWATLTTNFTQTTEQYPIIVPAISAYTLNTVRTNLLSLLLTDLDRYPSNSFSSTATAMTNFFNLSNAQTGGNKTITNSSFYGTAFPRRNVSSLANGANSGINFGVESYIKLVPGPTDPFSIDGIIHNGRNGRFIIIENATGEDLLIANESISEATPDNRILTGTGSAVTTIGNAVFGLIYDTDALRWKLVFVSDSIAGTSGLPEIETIAALKARNVLNPITTVYVRGYSSLNDGGQGIFVYDATSVDSDDGGIVFTPTTGGGKWKRAVDGRTYFASWWGPTRTNSTLQSAINYVSTSGGGTVVVGGGNWIVKSDDTNRVTMRSNVTLTTDADGQIVCAASPTNSWVLIDVALDSVNWTIGPARLVGWDLAAPGGDTNKTGVIIAAQDTVNGTVGGVRASNWYSQYADIGSGNQNLQMFDQDWQPGAMAHGAKGDGVTDDRRSLQSFASFCERYNVEFYMRPTTNGYLIGGTGEAVAGGVYFTNGVPVKLRGDGTIIKSIYYNPDEGVVPRYSTAFNITANNCSVEGFDFRTVGAYPTTETNASVTGFFIPLIVHMGTNTLIQNNTFTVESGKGIFLSGASYTKVLNNTFNDCGISTGNGHQPDWLWYEAAVPIKGGPSRSPIGCVFEGNIFNRGSPYKHTLFLSAADDFTVTKNHLVNMNGPLTLAVYSGDEGTTDQFGTNVYIVRGTIANNFISGTNIGSANAAIYVALTTPTNYVPITFTPSNMVSGITVRDNYIAGVGNGIEILTAPGTKVIGNDVRVSGSPLWYVGDVKNTIVEYNHLESTNTGVGNITITWSVGYLQPQEADGLVFRHNRVVTPPGDEYAIRTIPPNLVSNFKMTDNEFYFSGAAGTGDAPAVFQFYGSTNRIDISHNRFYITNTLSLRRLGRVLISEPNTDVHFNDNISIPMSPSVVLQGPILSGRTVVATGNDVGSMTFDSIDDLIVSRNILTSNTNSPIPLEITATRRASIVGNYIWNNSTVAALGATIAATNSTFSGNIVRVNSSSDIIRSTLGKMYVHNNVITNVGVGLTYPNGTGTGTISDDIYERPLIVDISGVNDYLFSFHRNGSPAKYRMVLDNYFTGSTRDAQFYIDPDSATEAAGLAFFARKADGNRQFVFGAHGFTTPVFYVGTESNATDIVLRSSVGLGTNILVYLNENRAMRAVTIGSGITFTNGILSGGGAASIQLPVNIAKLPSANPAELDATNTIHRLLFDDTTAQTVTWTFILPQNYGNTPKIRLKTDCNQVQTGNKVTSLNAYISAIGNGESTVSPPFAAANLNNVTWGLDQAPFVNVPVVISLFFEDNMVAGDLVVLKLERDAASGTDTAVGDTAIVGSVEFEYQKQ